MLPLLGVAQQTINGSITHDSMQRTYILYVPANYTGDSAVPLVLNYHGFTNTAAEQMNLAHFQPIADTAGFIFVCPQGTLFFGQTHWNVGGWTIGSTTDDVGFTEHLIDSLSSEYNIDAARIYSTGFSNGGFMSFHLACQLSEKIAAIASVSGSMTPQTYGACNAQHPTPIMQIHGTSDGVIPYGGVSYSEPINDVIDYWVSNNNCVDTAVITPLPDLDPGDGSTVEHHVYEAGDNGVTVEHFRVIGGGHEWPGTWRNMDIVSSEEIWKFFSRFDIDGLINSSCCLIRADINHDGAPEPDITDLIFMVTYMFQGGPEPACMDEADINGDGSETPDISDLIDLVEYMFQGGAAPVPCP
jgi:polyhydroxybutyrate depolymerase